jgi:hypothetical protein
MPLMVSRSRGLLSPQDQSQFDGQHHGDRVLKWIHHFYLDYAIEEPGRYHVADDSEVLLSKMNETYPYREEGRERRCLVLREAKKTR